MENKERVLAVVRSALAQRVITEDDLRQFVSTPDRSLDVSHEAPREQKVRDKVSAVDVMFYIAGIILYSAVLSLIVQTGGEGQLPFHIAASVGVGSVLWAAAYSLTKGTQSDIRAGLVNALLLTGSLSLITGGHIIASEMASGSSTINFIPEALSLGVVGVLHIAFDRLVRRDIVLLMGVLLAVAAVPALIFGLIVDSSPPIDIWCAVLIFGAGLLAAATRVVAEVYQDRKEVANAFDSFAAFVGLGSMFAASYGDNGIIWLLTLVASILGLFYMSILAKDRHLLGSASFFLVITIIMISFRYFSGFGVSVSLLLSTIGLLGSAAAAASINKKYFKS